MPKPIELGRSISENNPGLLAAAVAEPSHLEPIEENARKEADAAKEEIESLQSEMDSLRKQLEAEKWNSKQAAEYGLSLLEDFKKLQSRNLDLEEEIEAIKAELDSTKQVFIASYIDFI